MTRKGIRLFGAYVKENIGGIALAICAALMLTALFYLYELPKEPLIYALALVGAIALLPFLLKYAYIKNATRSLKPYSITSLRCSASCRLRTGCLSTTTAIC